MTYANTLSLGSSLQSIPAEALAAMVVICALVGLVIGLSAKWGD